MSSNLKRMTHCVVYYMKGKPKDSQVFPSFKEAQTFAIHKRAESECESCTISGLEHLRTYPAPGGDKCP